MLVPIESLGYMRLPISELNNTSLHPISHCFPVIVQYWSNYRFAQGVPLSDALILRNLCCEYHHRSKSYIAKNYILCLWTTFCRT